MPNAILRVGPFAKAGGGSTAIDSFLDESASYPAQSFANLILPVNCNTRSWVGGRGGVGDTDGEWSYLHITSNGSSVVGEMHSESGSSFTKEFGTLDTAFEYEGIYFFYQAAQSFTFAGSFSAEGTDGLDDDITFAIGDRESFSRYFSFNNGTHNPSGSFSITLPAAVVPTFVGLTFFGGNPAVEGSITVTGLNPT
tara:strand:+ start:15 stop:602 length:588 start_codon:yes stop_codon:yes gene_type:complete